MKPYLLLLVLSFISLSCEENFSPYGEFHEKYIFNCILRGDSTFQIAVLSRSYNPAEFNAESITEDMSIYGADIRILVGDSVYIFKDSSAVRQDTSNYKTPFHFYFNDRLELTANKEIEAEILLPTGRRVRSNTKTPPKIQFDQRSADAISDDSPNMFQFLWNISFTGQYFYPRMIITYTKKENGTNRMMTKAVPYTYSSESGIEQSVYPPIGVQSILNVEKNAVAKALAEISAGDPNKENYTIYEFARVQVLAFDQNLSRYYSVTNGSLDDLTVRVDESDYTNIEGGYGIFAAYIFDEYKIKFLPAYIQSFGYKFLVSN